MSLTVRIFVAGAKAVLRHGTIPLDVLEAKVESWIEDWVQ